MQAQSDKCVMVLDKDLPLGILANTAGIMGITLGKHIPETVGPVSYTHLLIFSTALISRFRSSLWRSITGINWDTPVF